MKENVNAGSISSIYHSRYDKIFAQFRSHNKAVVLDKMLFWWQHSKYQFKDDPSLWFTRDYEVMAVAMGIGLSTLKKYLSEFDKSGLIRRRSKLVSLKREDGSIAIKKRCFINITDKLLILLNISKCTKPQEEPPQTEEESTKNCDDDSFFAQPETIENLEDGLSYIKEDLGFSVNNSTISNAVAVDKPKDRLSEFAIEAEIGERLSQRDKNYIKGVLRNLEKTKPGLISNPEQAFAEIVFSILNDAQWTGTTENLRHRINIIAKLIRNRTWRTPKGFYNHCDFSQKFIPAGYKSRAASDTNTAKQGDEAPSTEPQQRYELEKAIRETESDIKACEMGIHSQFVDLERHKDRFSLAALISIVKDIHQKRQEEREYQNTLSMLKDKFALKHGVLDNDKLSKNRRAGYLKLSMQRMPLEMEILTRALMAVSEEVSLTTEHIAGMQENIGITYELYQQELALLQEELEGFAMAA